MKGLIVNATASDVEVRLYVRPDQTKFVKVRLRSKMRSNVISYKDIEAGTHLDEQKMRHNAEVVGGALAEYQTGMYGDTHDPSDCARAAREAFMEMMSDLRQHEHKMH